MRRTLVLLFLTGALGFSQPPPPGYPPPPRYPPPPGYPPPSRGYDAPLFPTGFAGVGASAPMNPTATRLNTGWNLMGGFGVTNGYFGATVDGLFTSFGLNDGTLQRLGARSGYERIGAITIDPHVHVN